MLNPDIAWPARWALALVLVTALAAGCAGEPDSTTAADGGQTVRGRIVDLNARSLLEVESLTIRDESGATNILEAGDEAGDEADGVELGRFTPSHLREHMVTGQVVEVRYHDEGGRLVLDAISD